MDVVDIAPSAELGALSYDEEAPYEAQLPTEAELAAEHAKATSLANRIGASKVYLLEDSSAAPSRVAKRKQENGEDVAEMQEDDGIEDSDPNHRGNAVLFTGEPISNLRTARLFAYATHFDAHPMGLEWVDDKTCIFVFSSKTDAREAFSKLTKPTHTSSSNALTSTEDVAPMALDDPMDSDFISAKPFPIALWPPEERINSTLGKGQGLKGPIRMRWARVDDIKRKGARDASQFYKKHGKSAGKELFNGRELPPASEPIPGKRKREFDDENENERRRQELDRELDDFLREDDDETPDDSDRRRKRMRRVEKSVSPPPEADILPPQPSPPSKMRSDYISKDGRTLLERTSMLRRHAASSDPLGEVPGLASRLTAPLPRRTGGRRRGGRDDDGRPGLSDRIRSSDYEGSGSDREMTRRRGGRRDDDRRGRGGGGGAGRTAERPKKTQQELDDELDAFLNAKD